MMLPRQASWLGWWVSVDVRCLDWNPADTGFFRLTATSIFVALDKLTTIYWLMYIF